MSGLELWSKRAATEGGDGDGVGCLPFHDEFDLVALFNAVHWVPEQEEANCALSLMGRARAWNT